MWRSAARGCFLGALAASFAGAEAPTDSERRVLAAAAGHVNAEIRQAAIAELESYAAAREGSDEAAQARLLLAEVLQKKGVLDESAVEFLKVLHEFPGGKTAARAKSGYLALISRENERHSRHLAAGLAEFPADSSPAERLGALWRRLAQEAPASFDTILEKEVPRFMNRFPIYRHGDFLLADFAASRAANARPAPALLAHQKLLALYPHSELRAQSLYSSGAISELLKEFDGAIEAYQRLALEHARSPQALPAMEAAARLLEEKRRDYPAAAAAHEKILESYPESPQALRAGLAKARLERERLSRPAEAVKTYERLAWDFHSPEGFSALRQAAYVARKDLKDYRLEADLRRKAASEFADYEGAAEELFAAAEIYEDDLRESAKAAEAYRELSSKFPSHKLSRKALDRLARLER